MKDIFKLIVFSFAFISAPIGLKAQNNPAGNNLEVCGAAVIHKKLLNNNSVYRKQVQENEAILQAAKIKPSPQNRSSQRISSQVLVIPVVVHVVHTGEAIGVGNNISEAQVNSAIAGLNNMYRKIAGTYGDGGGVDMGIEFQLAARDPNCNPTTGIVRVNGATVPNYATYGIKAGTVGADEENIKNLSRWPNTDYYNIWVVSEIDNNNGGAGIQGYAYFPGAPADLDGTIILNSAFGTTGTVKSYTNRGQTLAHEMGHAFNLYHTFEGDVDGTVCPTEVNGCGSDKGDCISDTEPHKRSQSTCPAGTLNSCTGTTIGSVYKNYMDYSSQTCSNEFTAEQKNRVQAAITNLRPGLVNSQALNAGPVVLPISATCSPSGTVGSNGYAMGIYKVALNNHAVVSDGTVNENAILVDRACSQQFLMDGDGGFPLTINTGPANNENVKVYLDYNNNGSFTDANELIFTSTNAKTHSSLISPPSGVLKNTPLRLRVVSDWAGNTISGSCYTPVYGQTEEYSVFFAAPLPVSWLSFTAENAGTLVNLNWETALEKNNNHFEIERSADAKVWQVIGRKAGSGNSTQLKAYSFTDNNALEGNNYYRLKQVDFNGTFGYSPVRMVVVNSGIAKVKVFPNPGSGLFNLELNGLEGHSIKLRVYNTNGSLIIDRQVAGQNQYQFSIQNQPAGLYLLEVIASNQKTYKVKLIKE